MSPTKNRFKERMQDSKFEQTKKKKQVTWDDLIKDTNRKSKEKEN